jgi:predicted ribosomally synthesized peptide with SipW-like signal peptide
MKKILFTLMVCVLCLGMIGAAFAYFTDSASSTGNSFTAGTLVMNLDGTTPFNVDNMAPGDTETAYLEVKNDGSLDMLFRAYVTNVTQDPTDFAGQLQVTITLHPTGYTVPGGYIAYGATDTAIYSGALSGIVGSGSALNNESAYFDDGWPLKSGYVAIYKIEVTMPTSLGNDYQGATLTGDIQIDATQAANQVEGSVNY